MDGSWELPVAQRLSACNSCGGSPWPESLLRILGADEHTVSDCLPFSSIWLALTNLKDEADKPVPWSRALHMHRRAVETWLWRQRLERPHMLPIGIPAV